MVLIKAQKRTIIGSLLRAPFAEGEGFKPPIPERGIPDFESSAIDHSANLPVKRMPTNFPVAQIAAAKVRTFSEPTKCFGEKNDEDAGNSQRHLSFGKSSACCQSKRRETPSAVTSRTALEPVSIGKLRRCA